MQDNPYSGILGVMRRDAGERSTEPWCIGRVETASPLTVSYGGNLLGADDLLVNAALLEGDSLGARLTGITGELSIDAVSSGTLAATLMRTTRGLSPGDMVAMLRSGDSQQFIVLCRVVNENG